MHIRGLVYSLLALFSVTLTAAAATLVWLEYKSALQEASRGAAAAAQAYAVHTSRNLEELRYGIDWLIPQIDPSAADYAIHPPIADTARTLARRLPGLSLLAVIGADGRVKFSTVTDAAVGENASHMDYFRATAEGNGAEFIGPAIEIRGTGSLVYTLSRRLVRDGQFAGVVVAAARIRRWNDIVAPLVPLPGSYLRLVRPDGGIIVAQRTRPDDGQLERVAGGNAAAAYPEASGVILARAPVQGSTLMAEVVVPREAALGDWDERRTRIAIGAAIGLLALLVFTLLAQRALRREAAAVRSLEARTHELHRALDTEKLLMAELQHRVKNSLSLAAGMLHFEKTRTRNDETRNALDRSQARILAIARVHDRLNESASPSSVSLDVYLSALCGDVAANAGLQYAVDADPVILPSAQAVSLGLIVTELLLNAAKHSGARPDARIPDARVEVDARATGMDLTLRVRDYGRGLPAGFEAAETGGLGMQIVSSLLAQLGGGLEVETATPGTRFILRVPLRPPSSGETQPTAASTV